MWHPDGPGKLEKMFGSIDTGWLHSLLQRLTWLLHIALRQCLVETLAAWQDRHVLCRALWRKIMMYPCLVPDTSLSRACRWQVHIEFS